MASYNHSAQVALLKAIHIFSSDTASDLGEIEHTAEHIEELTDCLTLGRILSLLDPDFDATTLNTDDHASPHELNRRNAQAVYKGLFRYVRRHVPELSCQAKNFNSEALMSQNENSPLSGQGNSSSLVPACFHMLAVMVTAAILGPDRQLYIPRISDCDKDTQAEVMQIICQMEADNASAKKDEPSDTEVDDMIGDRNVDLLVEEQNANLRQQLDTTRRKLSDYITRLEHLQISHDELVTVKAMNDRELETLRKKTDDGTAASIKSLQNTVNEQLDIIASYETQIRDLQKKVVSLENDLAKTEQRAREVEALRDQVAEMKHANEDLEKRANTVDRYKQKLEAQQEMVRELQNVQYERAELQEEIRRLTDEQDRSSRTRKGETELQKMIDQSEQHLWDERSHKDQLMRELTILTEEINRLNAQRSHDEQFISELQERLQSGDAGSDRYAGDVETGALGSLADELTTATITGDGQVPSLETSRLRAENNLLRGAQGESAQLRQDLQEEKMLRGRLQAEYNTLFHKHALLQDQADSLAKNATSPDAQGFVNLQKEWRQGLTEIEQLRVEKKDLEANVADQERDLLQVRGELAAAPKEGMDAISDLRNTDQLIAQSLKRELEHQRKEASFATSERNNLQEQLVKAYIAMETQRKDGGVGNAVSVPDGAKDSEDSNKIEKLRERLIERNKVGEALMTAQIHEQTSLILRAIHDFGYRGAISEYVPTEVGDLDESWPGASGILDHASPRCQSVTDYDRSVGFLQAKDPGPCQDLPPLPSRACEGNGKRKEPYPAKNHSVHLDSAWRPGMNTKCRKGIAAWFKSKSFSKRKATAAKRSSTSF